MATDSVLFETYPFPDEREERWLSRILLSRTSDGAMILVLAERPRGVDGRHAGEAQLPAVLEALATKLGQDFDLSGQPLQLLLSEQPIQGGLVRLEQMRQVFFASTERQEFSLLRYRRPILQAAGEELRQAWPDVFLPAAVSSGLIPLLMPRKQVPHQNPASLQEMPDLEAILVAHRVSLRKTREQLGITDMRTLKSRLAEPGRLTCTQIEQLAQLLNRPASELLEWVLTVALPPTEMTQLPLQGREFTCAQLKLFGELVGIPVDQLLQRVLNVHILSA
ncbi:hypothetical protein KLP40_14350 [Hymenobacter sp. NST-14]|uniref:hypothetical protein n=1 Tax=Hymenobacter piscis TaxID=2839984 RepID=UPI001C022EBC|nr:hypothetical protein [Hymenobacter piscis]MBT9394348.1 hypothetical protein [Hymenobacter piscis]